MTIVEDMDAKESRAMRENLDEECLALFDLLKRPDLTANDIKRIKAVASKLLATLKAEKLRIDHWRDKESTRDAVRQTIQDFLWSDETGLPITYSENDIQDKTDDVFMHIKPTDVKSYAHRVRQPRQCWPTPAGDYGITLLNADQWKHIQQSIDLMRCQYY